jgi:hypothetical protein
MLKAIATLETSTTRLMVSDGQWNEPTEVTSKLDTPTMSLLIYERGYCAEGAFLGGDTRNLCKVGRVIFTPHDREVLGRGTSGKMRVVFVRPCLLHACCRFVGRAFQRAAAKLSQSAKCAPACTIYAAHD